jgi:hypothetical protein
MTAAKILHTTITSLAALGDQLNQLRRMVDLEESAPHLVEELHAHTLAAIGYQVCALDAARAAGGYIEQQNDLENARRSLAECTQALQDCCRIFYEYLFTVNRITDVVDLLNKESEASWANITIGDLNACHISLQSAAFALMDGWQELAGRAAASAVSLRSTNIGQQYLFPAKNQP